MKHIRLFVYSAILLSPISVLAEGVIQNPLQSNSLLELLSAVVHGVTRIGAIALVFALVWTGFQFVVAQGNEEKIRGARTMFLWTVVGGAILLGAELIANIITSTAGSLAP